MGTDTRERMRMRVPVTVHRGRPGGIRVLRPRHTLTGLTVQDGDRFLLVCLDRAGAESLVGLWALAARSPRSIVHLPLCADAAPAASWNPAWDTLDLVLVHHSLGFPPSAWKRLRSRLDAGRPHTAVLPADALPEEEDTDRPQHRDHREHRDRLHGTIAARTLVLTGSATAFGTTGSELRHALLDTTAGDTAPEFDGDLRTALWIDPARGRTRERVEMDFLLLGGR